MPKIEDLDHDLPSENIYSNNVGGNAASSSGSNVRSSFIGMGFAPLLVDRAIEENGEDNVDLLLETLFAYSALQKQKSEQSDAVDGFFDDNNELAACSRAREAPHRQESSDSLDSLFGHDDDTYSRSNNFRVPLKEEQPDVWSGVSEKRASLAAMNFPVDEVELAINKLGEDAPINELVDFIFAAQIADDYEKGADDPIPRDAEMDQEYPLSEPDILRGEFASSQGCSTEAMFGIMEKTLLLLEMGFSEQEVSTAIENCGSEVPVSELAASIVAEQDDGTCTKTDKCIPSSSSIVKPEYSSDDISLGNFDFLEKFKGKRPKEQYIDELGSFKRPKQELDEDSFNSLGPAWLEARNRSSVSLSSRQMRAPLGKVHRKAEEQDTYATVKMPMPNSCRTFDMMVATAPYFFYGSVTSLSHDLWVQISKFLYAVQPEFVNTLSFSALSRQEGYVHNLPTENRFHIFPKPPMTIEEAIPHTRKWWPSWDTRKHLSCINSETVGISELCEKLGRMLHSSKGHMSAKEQEDVLDQCRMLNLLWVGQYKLASVEPEDLECILGYPMNHTRAAGFSLTERLQSLKYSFQIDTLAYHLSALRSCFPGGLIVLSLYTGIGGPEIALHKLGIQLKAVVSVEPSETKRKILKHWWENHGISGDLLQVESIQSLTSNKLAGLISKYGGFDFVICQNPPPYSPKNSTLAADGNATSAWDFQLFYEFVRVLRHVKCAMQKNR